LSTPSKLTDASPDAFSHLKRYANYNKVYKEAAQNKDDLGRKRLKMDEQLADAQMETMKKEAASREKEVVAREKEVVAHKIEVKTCTKEAQTSALEKIYRDLREELKDAKADNCKDEIERIKKELDEIRKIGVELVTK
jgi:hypothetical protein